MTAVTELGPIDYLVVEWPADSPPTGEAFPLLIDLVDRGLVRIIDFTFVQKGEDGSTFAVKVADLDLDGVPEITMLAGASTGLLGEEDYAEVGEVLGAGCAAAVLVYENVWARPFAVALRGSGAQLVGYGHVPVADLISVLDELETAEA